MTRCARCATEMSALAVFCPHCQHPNEPDFKQLIHQTLGHRFQIYRQLSEGGLSTVFAAIDLHSDKTVVVKVSDPRHLAQTNFNSAAELAEARHYWTEMTERMQREVTALTDINHPNIVRVFAAGVIADDLSFVVMELLRGKTLREELNTRGKLPHQEAVALASEVAAGLKIIHAQNIVHRDLTPRNIFLCETPTETAPSAFVKLIDFGIAKFPKPPGAQTYTQHAVMAGTPGYAAPEQFQNLAVDHRADIYSLGVVLYEMLTGEKPFTGRTATEIALKQLSSEPVRPRVLVPDLPIRLEALILRALAKDPLVRPQNVDDFLHELKAISLRVEIPLLTPVAASVLAPVMSAPEPSGTDVYAVLTNFAAPAENKISAPVNTPKTDPVIFSSFADKTEEVRPATGKKWLLAAAGLLLTFVAASWLLAQQNLPSFSALQTALPEPTASVRMATPTPTLRPDVTAPRNLARTIIAQNLKTPTDTVTVEPASLPTRETGSLAKSTPTSNAKPANNKPTLPVPTSRPTATPTPELVAARNPPPTPKPMPQMPPRVEPTPTPAPAPILIDPPSNERPDNTRNNNEAWKRETVPPNRTPHDNDDVPRPRREEVIPDPKVISWQGHVDGSREIVLELPGVPGMIDVPRSFRKKVGVVEPPSPSNGWRRAVLRVFGKGEVMMIVRWWPQRSISQNHQELVQWTKSK